MHPLDEDTFVLRVSKCSSFEGNVLYLLLGEARAVLFDTGRRPGPAAGDRVLPIRRVVDGIVAGWRRSHGLDAIDLVMVHTHGHGDHVAWDRDFQVGPRTSVVPPTLPGAALPRSPGLAGRRGPPWAGGR